MRSSPLYLRKMDSDCWALPTLTGGTRRELQRRIKAAWGKFHMIWHLLRHRAASLKQRLKLFNAVVGKSLLWASESWTLTVAEKNQLQAVQRSMLRRFAGPRKREEEDWLTWIRKATRIATENAEKAGVKCWVREHLYNKWRWAGHVARMGTHRPNSWAYRTTIWRGTKWQEETNGDALLLNHRPLRARAGRWTRWETEIANFCKTRSMLWTEAAEARDEWKSLADDFVTWCWK